MMQPKKSHYRFFVEPQVITGDKVVIADRDLIHQLSRVFRLQPGDIVVLLDNTGYEYLVELGYVGAYEVTGDVKQRREGTTEASVPITLFMPVLKGQKNEYILEKATELGVAEIVPVVYAHSIVREVVSKFDRWNAIIREAAEQSHRVRLPVLREEILSSGIFTLMNGKQTVLVGDERSTQHLDHVLRDLESPPKAFAVIIGPEGGLSDEERTLCEENGAIAMSLAKTVLRADTAAILATGILSYFMVE